MKKLVVISVIGVIVTIVIAALATVYTGIDAFGMLALCLGIPASVAVAWIMSQNPYSNGTGGGGDKLPTRQQQRTEQDGEAGVGGGGNNPQAGQPSGKRKIALPALFNLWVIGVLLWIPIAIAYAYFGYFWAGMPLWLGVFTLLVIPAPKAIVEMFQSKGRGKENASWMMRLLNLLGAGKAWRGVLVLVVLVAESMLYWYYLLPSIPTVGFYLLLLVATILGARRMVVEESQVAKDEAKGGDDKQPEGGRKSGDIGNPPGAD